MEERRVSVDPVDVERSARSWLQQMSEAAGTSVVVVLVAMCCSHAEKKAS